MVVTMKNIYGIGDVLNTEILNRGRIVFREGDDGPYSVSVYISDRGHDSIFGRIELSSKYADGIGFLDEDAADGSIGLTVILSTRGDDEFYGPSIRVDETKDENESSVARVNFERPEEWDRHERGPFEDPISKWRVELDPHGDEIGFHIYRVPTTIDERNAPDVEPGDVFIDDDSVLHVLTEDNLHVEDGWRLIAEGVSTVKF